MRKIVTLRALSNTSVGVTFPKEICKEIGVEKGNTFIISAKGKKIILERFD